MLHKLAKTKKLDGLANKTSKTETTPSADNNSKAMTPIDLHTGTGFKILHFNERDKSGGKKGRTTPCPQSHCCAPDFPYSFLSLSH